MRVISIILLSVTLATRIAAQADTVLVRDAHGKTLKRLGRNAIRQDDPASAIIFLQAYLKERPDDARAMFMLGTAFAGTRDYERAQPAFLSAYSMSRGKLTESLFYHAQMQKSNGHYDSARICLQKFRKEYKGGNSTLKKNAGRDMAFCDSIQGFMKRQKPLAVQRLDSTVNKLNSEGGMLALDDNTMVFTSLRTDKKLYITEGDTAHIPRQKLYQAIRRNGKWQFAGEFPLNDDNYNNGNPALSPDRKRLYFSRCRETVSQDMHCDLYVSERTGDSWSEPVKLPEEVNHKKYGATMPAVTSDPAKGNEMIFFVSRRRKGRGGDDIWYTTFDRKTGKYKPAKNGGNKVNTAGDEITPYFDNETRALYFSSDGHSGMGGFDVFKAVGDGRKFSQVENVGAPVNSGADDVYYQISTNREEGFFASNRKTNEAAKKRNATCCDDIYAYSNPAYVHVNLKGSISEAANSKASLKGAKVDVYLLDPISGERFLVRTTTTDSIGRYQAKLEAGQDYVVLVRKKDFMGTTEEISTKGINASQDIVKNVQVKKRPKEPILIPNFQYDFGKSDLSATNKAQLDKQLIEMMNANPEVVVEIQAHTDSKGNDAYNQKLSQTRADNIVKYVISRGILKERIKGVGYGETKPIAPNENPDGSDSPEGRAKNRRTEFKITGELSPDE